MAYTNSPLIMFQKALPHHYSGREKIDTITIHCVAGVNCSLDAVWNVLNNAGASCNYCIDSYGTIGLFVEEKYGSWCSSDKANDMRAITFEVVNSGGAPNWPVTDAALKSIINLCTDICRRNGKKRMIWIGDKATALAYKPASDEMRMTVHRWFSAKACPGDYLMSKMPYIAEQVTKLLGTTPVSEPLPQVKVEPESANIYRVQTGAFKSRDNASKMLAELQTKGYEGIVVLASDFYKVQLGAFRVESNAKNLLDSVKKLGYDAFITTKSGTMVASYTKSLNDVAMEVIRGDWGSGPERTRQLTAAGYDAAAVQRRVNELL